MAINLIILLQNRWKPNALHHLTTNWIQYSNYSNPLIFELVSDLADCALNDFLANVGRKSIRISSL